MPDRKPLRLPDFDYAAAGAYFVTVCSYLRRPIFGRVVGDRCSLSSLGEVVQSIWQKIPAHFKNTQLDEYIVMPNHVHGILWILPNDSQSNSASQANSFAKVGARHASPLQTQQAAGTKSGSLGAIIGSFKSALTREANRQNINNGQPIWQRNYHEHILRDEEDLFLHRKYIQENPLKWALDDYHA